MSINLTQNFLIETDEIKSFRKILNAIVRIVFDEKPDKYSQLFVTTRLPGSFEDGKVYKKGKESEPLYSFICSVGDYKSDIKKGDKRFRKYKDLVDTVVSLVKAADEKAFFKECGSGYNDWFNEHDGSVGAGYRINHRSNCGWHNFDVSMCHIYYGK